jgi:hypothetical protein
MALPLLYARIPENSNSLILQFNIGHLTASLWARPLIKSRLCEHFLAKTLPEEAALH